MRTWILGLLVASLAVGVTGCINYEEEITLRANGSGEATLHYWMSSALVSNVWFTDEEAIRKDFEGLEGVKLTEVKFQEEGGNRHVLLKVRFQNVEKLAAVEKLTVGGQEWIKGTITFKRERGKLHFTRTLKSPGTGQARAVPGRSGWMPGPRTARGSAVKPRETVVRPLSSLEKETPPSGKGRKDLGETLGRMGRELGEGLEKMGEQMEKALRSPQAQKGKETVEEEVLAQMMGEAFGGYKLKFTVHFPGPVLEVDAWGWQRGNTATWEFSLGTLLANREIAMQATARAPFPWGPVGVGAGIGFLLVLLGWARRRARKSLLAEPQMA